MADKTPRRYRVTVQNDPNTDAGAVAIVTASAVTDPLFGSFDTGTIPQLGNVAGFSGDQIKELLETLTIDGKERHFEVFTTEERLLDAGMKVKR